MVGMQVNDFNMKKFVKLSSVQRGEYEGWFLELKRPTMSLDENIALNSTMLELEFYRGLKENGLNAAERLRLIATNPPNYNQLCEKYGTLYIRQSGSYMTQSSDAVVASQVFQESWPTDNEFAEIVVCENDFEAENRWMLFLDYYLPSIQVNVLNTFRHRSLSDVQKHFQHANYITFTTTFTNFDWFELLLDGMEGLSNKTILGHTYDLDKWEEIKQLYGDQIKKLIENGNQFTVVKSMSVGDIKIVDLISTSHNNFNNTSNAGWSIRNVIRHFHCQFGTIRRNANT